MNKRTFLFLLLLVALAGTSAYVLFSPTLIAHAREGGMDMGAILDYMLTPKQITGIEAASQWRNDLLPREVFAVITASEEIYSRATIPVQSDTIEDGNPVADEYIYYVLQLKGDDDAFGTTNEGESREYWMVNEDLYVGPVEAAMNYTPLDVTAMVPILLDDAINIYNESRINIYTLVSFENSVTAEALYYEQISGPFPLDLIVKAGDEVDVDENALPDDLLGLVDLGQSWFDSNGLRNVVASTLDFPDEPLAPGQATDTGRLIPDDPDYDVVVELPRADALFPGDKVVGIVQTARDFGAMFDDALPTAIQTALDKAPGAWLEGINGEMVAVGIVVLHDDGTKTISPVDIFAVPGRLEIGNIAITLEPEDVRTLGFWSYPLDIVDDPSSDYFSLPPSGQWAPVAVEVQYDELDNMLSGEISGGGAIMPMLVAMTLYMDNIDLVTAPACEETLLTVNGAIPVWMGANPASGLTASEATDRYEAVIIKGATEVPMTFTEQGGYAVTALDSNSENLAYLTIPANWTEMGLVTLEIRDKEDPSNSTTFVDAITVVDAPPVIELLSDNYLDQECGVAYVDPGATALDGCDGDLTENIIIGGDIVDTTTLGVYEITFNVSDSVSNAAEEVSRFVTVVDRTPPEITLLGQAEVDVVCGGSYIEAGAAAFDSCEGNLTTSVVVGGDVVNTEVSGSYQITYNVSDSASNAAVEVTRTVNVTDAIVPTIALLGNAAVTIECGDVYNDAGATADDNCDGDLTADLIVAGDAVYTAATGIYTITYNVSDNAANPADEVTRTVTVEDTTAPVIALVGDANVAVECGNAYMDDGVIATDTCDGDLLDNVAIGGDIVDTAVPGTYVITYNVSDNAGNTATEVMRTVTVTDTTAPEIVLAGDATMQVECNGQYGDPGVTATDACDGDLSDSVAIGGDAVDTAVPGIYEVTYNVGDSAGNIALEVTRTVTVADTTVPAIALTGDAMMQVECNGEYVELGATATDICDGDLTANLIIAGDAVYTALKGVYTVTYNVSDGASNAASEVTRTVTVADTTAPEIVLIGDATVQIECRGEYVEQGATATDTCDGDLSDSVAVAGDVVDTIVPGTYVITYNVSDNAENAASEVKRTVTVTDTTTPIITLNGDATVQVDCSGDYVEPGATATDACDGDLTGSVVIGGAVVDTAVPGDYVITYNVSDSASNAATEVTRTVTVLDNCGGPCNPDDAAPVITLNGDPVVTVECKGVYTELGATVTDNCDDNLAGQIRIGGDVVNTHVTGVYNITYNVTDTAGNQATEVTRTVNVVDTTPPDISRIGEEEVLLIECKSEYVDSGAIAMDGCVGNLTSSIEVYNPVNTDVPDTYEIVYNVSDASGNEAPPLIRTVHVMDTIPPTMSIGELDPALTYDDDGFLILEAGTPFITLEPETFTATDSCAGNLGLPKATVEEDTPGVLAWAWVLGADGEPRWFNDAGDIRPVVFAYDEFTSEVGDFLLVYLALDGEGNSYPAVNSIGIPYILDEENHLDIFDEEGNLKEELKTHLRLVRIEDTTPPEISLVGSPYLTIDCGVEFVDPGVSVTDNTNEDIEYTYSGEVDVNVPGPYVRTYYASDSSGNTQELARRIAVKDNCPVLYYNLVVSVLGDGAVEVTPEQEAYEVGATVTLKANPVFKSRFVNWSGDASGNEDTITLVMDSDKEVLANFNPIVRLTAVVSPPSGGNLVFAPDPLELVEGDEVGTWVATYDTGTVIAVSVEPADRYRFRDWDGDVEQPEDTGCRRELMTTVTLELDKDKSVEAILKKKLPWWFYVLVGIGVAGAIAGIAGG